ncbi:MAG: hypothetical protein K0S46_1259 [Moraxellaceae bacterium]|nr:hypothetical protein [Moraxellaceae bacterium]
MTRKQQQSPEQTRRDQSRSAQTTNRNPHQQQSFASRDIQRGTQRSETQVEGGQRRNDGGSPDTGAQNQTEHGDDKRPHKRAGR